MASIKKQSNSIVSARPASWWGETWREGFFVGNGIFGANVCGGASEEKIILNHSDLQWQGRISVVPDVSFKLKEARKMIADKQFDLAGDVLVRALVSKNFRPQHFYPLPTCVLCAKSKIDKGVREYERSLNMGTGETSVTYLDGQTRINRKLFVSRANDTLVYEITKTGGNKQLDIEFSLKPLDDFASRTVNTISNTPDNIRRANDKYFMYFSARNDDGGDYGAVARLNHYGGSLTQTQNGARISGANSIIVYVKLFVKSTADKEFARLKTELAALKDPYDKLFKQHASLHQKAFGGSTISFDGDKEDYIENLIEQSVEGEPDPLLLEKLWKYSKYLLITCSTDGGRLFAPYGLWNGCYKPYKSVLPFSGGAEEVYDYTLGANLTTYCESLFAFIEEHIGEYKDNAIRLFNCKGVFIPSISATNTGRLGSISPEAVYFTGCAGYIAKLYNDYYLVTGDTKVLKSKIIPFMMEVAQFYKDYFKIDDDGKYTSSPSILPPVTLSAASGHQTVPVGKDCYADFAICAEVLSNLIDRCNELGIFADEIAEWKEMLAKLPSYDKGKDGAILDYAKDNHFKTEDLSNNAVLFRARACTKDELDAEQSDLTVTAKKRFVEGSEVTNSFSQCTLASTLIKLSQRRLALECLNNTVRGCAMSNLAFTLSDWRGMGVCGNDLWSPMQLQSNIAFANAVTKLFILTQNKKIIILPGMVSDWTSFKAEDLLSYGGTQVDITYNVRSALLQVDIKARKATTFSLYLPEGARKLSKCSNKALKYNADICCVPDIELGAGKSVSFTFAYRAVK